MKAPTAPRAPNLGSMELTHLGGEVRPVESRYPQFDVMAEAERWDAHTRDIVMRRLEGPHKFRTLDEHQVRTLKVLARHLLYEDRHEILTFAASHVDARIHDQVGESQRKPEIPPEDVLVRSGLKALDAIANSRHQKAFVDCDVDQQFAIVSAMQLGQLEPLNPDEAINAPQWSDPQNAKSIQKAFFKKVLGLMVDALASHPLIWSEIGYAGPAYPRGYYRIERGLTDPWEPRAPKELSRSAEVFNGKAR